MNDAQRQVQIQKLKEQQAAAQVKFDRMLQELERIGGQRIKSLDEVMPGFDLESLKSVIFDIESALASYTTASAELKRINT